MTNEISYQHFSFSSTPRFSLSLSIFSLSFFSSSIFSNFSFLPSSTSERYSCRLFYFLPPAFFYFYFYRIVQLLSLGFFFFSASLQPFWLKPFHLQLQILGIFFTFNFRARDFFCFQPRASFTFSFSFSSRLQLFLLASHIFNS